MREEHRAMLTAGAAKAYRERGKTASHIIFNCLLDQGEHMFTELDDLRPLFEVGCDVTIEACTSLKGLFSSWIG